VLEKADVRRKNSLYGRKARKYSMFCFSVKHKTILLNFYFEIGAAKGEVALL